jgi:hypothetical protein
MTQRILSPRREYVIVKTSINVDDLRPGYQLAEPVRDNGSILFEAGYNLSAEDIVLLKVWRIPTVNVESTTRERSAA